MATKRTERPLGKKPSKSRKGNSQVTTRYFTVMGFTVEAGPMPDHSAETLYTLTHPDLPGMVVGDSDPWQAMLNGLDAASLLLRQNMDAGEKLTMKSRR